MENDKIPPSFQLIDSLFFMFDALGFFAELVGLCLFEAGLFEVTGSQLDTLLVLFDHPAQGALFLFVGFVLEDGFEFQ